LLGRLISSTPLGAASFVTQSSALTSYVVASQSSVEGSSSSSALGTCHGFLTSSAKVELSDISFVTAEVTWLRWLLEDFGVSISMLTPLLSNSTCAISMVR
jgi:hypothetical protein